jgi:hypothetical protein
MAPPTKDEIVNYLKLHGLVVPENATYAELKVLYTDLKAENAKICQPTQLPNQPTPGPSGTGKPALTPSAGPSGTQKSEEDELIDQLEKLKRMLSLQKEISDLQQHDKTPKKVNFDDVRHMPPFNGTNAYRVERWLADFENLIESLNGNDTDKLRLVRRFLEGSAKKSVQYKIYDTKNGMI